MSKRIDPAIPEPPADEKKLATKDVSDSSTIDPVIPEPPESEQLDDQS